MTTTSTGRYNPSVHAVERIREYFGILEDSAKTFINETLRKAKYVTTQQDGNLVYKCDDKDAMIVVNAKSNIVITILPPNGKGKHNSGIVKTEVKTVYSAEGNEFLSSFQATVKRELSKARRQFTRESRYLTESIAVLGLEIAQLTLNKARARSPVTQKHITKKVTLLSSEQARLGAKRRKLETHFNALCGEVKEYMTN